MDHHIKSECPENNVMCEKCDENFKRKYEQTHDCISYLKKLNHKYQQTIKDKDHEHSQQI